MKYYLKILERKLETNTNEEYLEVKIEVEELEKNTEVEDVKTNDDTEIKKAGNAGITYTSGGTGADVNAIREQRKGQVENAFTVDVSELGKEVESLKINYL